MEMIQSFMLHKEAVIKTLGTEVCMSLATPSMCLHISTPGGQCHPEDFESFMFGALPDLALYICLSLPNSAFFPFALIINHKLEPFPQLCESFWQVIKPERVVGTPKLQPAGQKKGWPRVFQICDWSVK